LQKVQTFFFGFRTGGFAMVFLLLSSTGMSVS
jgi:hypothetical protein